MILQCIGKGKAGTGYIGTECPSSLIEDTISGRINTPREKGREGPCCTAELLRTGFPGPHATTDTRKQGQSEASICCFKAVLPQLCSLKPSDSAEREMPRSQELAPFYSKQLHFLKQFKLRLKHTQHKICHLKHL